MMADIFSHRTIGIDLALAAATATLEAARSRAYPRTGVAVANRYGQIMVLLRSDEAGPHLLDSARRKAYTAASMNARTSKASKAVDERTGEPDPHLVYLDEVLLVGDGVPIHAGGELVGAIGCAGAPGSIHDEECADAGLRRLRIG